MGAKSFFYASAGLLCLVAAYSMGASRALAEWGGEGLIVGTNGIYFWDASGRAWSSSYTTGEWHEDERAHLPPEIDVGKVKYCVWSNNGQAIVTRQDEVWVWTPDGWARRPPFPGGPSAITEGSFARSKSTFRR